MSETPNSPTPASPAAHPEVMETRHVVKDDGRTLIFYAFQPPAAGRETETGDEHA